MTGKAKRRQGEERKRSATTLDVRTKRIYENAEPGDDRVLIDHIWPRGISKERARLDEWAPELAPSDELRKFVRPSPVPLRHSHFATATSSRTNRRASRSFVVALRLVR